MQNLKKNFYQITPYVLLSVDVYNIYRTPQAFADNLAVSICLTSLLGNKYGDMNKIFGANIMNIFIKADKFLKLDYIQLPILPSILTSTILNLNEQYKEEFKATRQLALEKIEVIESKMIMNRKIARNGKRIMSKKIRQFPNNNPYHSLNGIIRELKKGSLQIDETKSAYIERGINEIFDQSMPYWARAIKFSEEKSQEIVNKTEQGITNFTTTAMQFLGVYTDEFLGKITYEIKNSYVSQLFFNQDRAISEILYI